LHVTHQTRLLALLERLHRQYRRIPWPACISLPQGLYGLRLRVQETDLLDLMEDLTKPKYMGWENLVSEV
jgi:hypothetical protein